MQASRAIATTMNVVQTGHSYGDIMLHVKAQEAKQVCSFYYWLQWYLHPSQLIAFSNLKFVSFPLYTIVKFKLANKYQVGSSVVGWHSKIIFTQKISGINRNFQACNFTQF